MCSLCCTHNYGDLLRIALCYAPHCRLLPNLTPAGPAPATPMTMSGAPPHPLTRVGPMPHPPFLCQLVRFLVPHDVYMRGYEQSSPCACTRSRNGSQRSLCATSGAAIPPSTPSLPYAPIPNQLPYGGASPGLRSTRLRWRVLYPQTYPQCTHGKEKWGKMGENGEKWGKMGENGGGNGEKWGEIRKLGWCNWSHFPPFPPHFLPIFPHFPPFFLRSFPHFSSGAFPIFPHFSSGAFTNAPPPQPCGQPKP